MRLSILYVRPLPPPNLIVKQENQNAKQQKKNLDKRSIIIFAKLNAPPTIITLRSEGWGFRLEASLFRVEDKVFIRKVQFTRG